jgi:2,4-dienoyl-CoA reductase [(3E)-enoyl-CoA-producing], mitochondrial
MNKINFNLFKSNKIVLDAVKKAPFLSHFYKNNNVLITGGGTGLGKKMAEVYSSMGANVTIASRKEEVLKKTCNEIFKITGNPIDYGVLNLKDHDSITEFVSNVDKVPDIVINNAAGNFICRSEDLSYNGWNSIIDIVLKGTVDMTLQMGKKMINNKQPGVFVNISTTYANTGSGFVLPSAIAKAGCDNLTKSLAAEWGKYGIRLLSVAPGPIYTEGAFNRLDPTGDFQKKVIKNLPMGRLGEQEELANFIVYLTSQNCNWLTGQIINFDGGEVVGNSGEFNILHSLSNAEWSLIKKMSK